MAWQVSTLSNDQVNPAPNAVQDPMSQSDKDISYKRQFAIRRDTDKVKNISIDLQDVDGTIIDFLNNKLNLQVMDNGEVVKVPIIYGSPERWTAMKKEGFIRDNQGKNQAIVPYSEKNKYDRFEVMNNNILFNSRPTKQIFTVSMPKQVLVTYECVIWTDYVDQNNKLLEQITYACNDYWGDKERLKFIVNADSFTTDIEMDDNNDRNVKTTFNLVVTAYLLNPSFVPGIEGIKNTTQKMFTIRKIKLNEAAVDGEQMDDIKNNVKQYGFEDTTSIKDKDKDFAYVDGIGVQSIPSNTIKDGNPIIKKTTSITKTPFHAPPKSSKEYGENGWVAYDSNYLYIYQYPLGWIRRAISVFDYDPTTSTYISGYNDCDQPIYTTSSRRPINTAFRIFQRFPDKFYQQTPIQSGDYGEDGWISYDGSYLYIYSAGSWRRIVTALFETF